MFDKKRYAQEYAQKNKEQLKKYKKEYYHRNKDRVIQQRKEYRKKYYQKNKEILNQRSKEYYHRNKKRRKGYCQEYQKKYLKKYPLKRLLRGIRSRCGCLGHNSYKYYGGRGIKCFLTVEDLKFLWDRDNAHLLKQPSIDRKNNNDNYVLDNCQFIELVENIRKANRPSKVYKNYTAGQLSRKIGVGIGTIYKYSRKNEIEKLIKNGKVTKINKIYGRTLTELSSILQISKQRCHQLHKKGKLELRIKNCSI